MTIPLTPHATLHPLVLPARADGPDAAELHEYAEMRNRLLRELTGRDEQDMAPAELLPLLGSTPDETRLAWFIRLGGAIVGRAALDMPTHPGSQVAYVGVELLPEVWGRGIGTAALAHLERSAREHGRTVLQTWAEQKASGGEHLTAATGFGSVPHDHAARFLLRHSYSLEQVERISRLPLSDATRERSAALQAVAQEHASGYRVIQWMLPTPEEHRESYAWMKSRMNTDVPSGALTFDEEVWDAARVERNDAKRVAGGNTVLVTAAQHVDSGALCAFNELRIGLDRAATSHQWETLVLSTHRGHRLGMLVKCAGIVAWHDVTPDSPAIITYNAEENRPMLSINEEIGFEPISYEGAWQKVLT